MGAVIAAPLLAMAFAMGASFVYGEFEGAAAMGGGMTGGAVGVLAGFGGGLSLVLHKGGQWGAAAVTWLTVGAILTLVCLAFVAFS
jgi:hypothetical protein